MSCTYDFRVGIDCVTQAALKKFGEAELSRPCICAVGAGPAGILSEKRRAETAAANFAAKEAFLKPPAPVWAALPCPSWPYCAKRAVRPILP